jgi:hypothetical protein
MLAGPRLITPGLHDLLLSYIHTFVASGEFLWNGIHNGRKITVSFSHTERGEGNMERARAEKDGKESV